MRILLSLLLMTSVAFAQSVPSPLAICDAANSPKTRLAKGGYSFCDPDHWITENEFIRRYREVTGSHDLDSHEVMRTRTRWIFGAVLGAVGLGLFTYGVATIRRNCQVGDVTVVAECTDAKLHLASTQTTFSVLSESLAAIGGGAFLAGTVLFLARPGRDGGPLDHQLNRFAAQLALRRYEAARRAPPPEVRRTIEVRPYVSSSGGGVVARF
jgi:hypothetical protein